MKKKILFVASEAVPFIKTGPYVFTQHEGYLLSFSSRLYYIKVYPLLQATGINI